MPYRFTAKDALARLTPKGPRFVDLLRHGTLRVELYAPREDDPQQPHAQDEVYVVATGSGTFVHGEQKVRFGPGDLLFVPAGEPHRFEEFSPDLAVWVLFYGPRGGEDPRTTPAL